MATGIWNLSSSSAVCTKLQSGGDISAWEWRWKLGQVEGGCGRSGRRWTDGQCRLSTRSRVDWFRRFEVAAAKREVDEEFALPSKFVHGKMLSEVSSWGIGGPAKMFVEVTDATEMASVLRYCTNQDIKWFVVGKGLNCLFDDRGFDGCVILNRVNFLKNLSLGMYHVGSGYPFNQLGIQCSRDGFSGLEFAGGIPGTVGGAIYMNAGADGQETGGVVQMVDIVTIDGVSHTLSKESGELDFQYRISPFQKMKHSAVIVGATFELVPDVDAKQRQRSYLERRKRSQPVSEKSAGCVFCNPGVGCQSAGALIEQAGLKGMQVGGARVSERHANFLVNGGGSRSQDMQTLIAMVKEKVHNEFDVELHEEILYIPYS